jgi:hypothetical protein
MVAVIGRRRFKSESPHVDSYDFTSLAEVWGRCARASGCAGLSFGRGSESGAKRAHSRTWRNFGAHKITCKAGFRSAFYGTLFWARG